MNDHVTKLMHDVIPNSEGEPEDYSMTASCNRSRHNSLRLRGLSLCSFSDTGRHE